MPSSLLPRWPSGCLAVETDARLAERVLSTEPLAHWREAIQQAFVDLDLAWPGGESSRAAMVRGRAAIDVLLARSERVSVVVTHGNLMTLILRSFETQFGFQTWERLSRGPLLNASLSPAGRLIFRHPGKFRPV